jgi:6-phosphogluconate dehydrogenase
MAGGEREPVSILEPILRELAVDGGFVHAGGPGAGHFVKLVHNGIEFGMLQAIAAEGIDLLEALPREVAHRGCPQLLAPRLGDPILAHRADGGNVS